jgi:hypothetical protein
VPYIKEDTPTHFIITEDNEFVKVGDKVWCYYDGVWGTIVSIKDNHSTANEEADNRNQCLWADVVCEDNRTRSYNGQRLASKKF